MIEKVKAVISGWAEAGAEEPSPGVGAGSCSGNPVPAPNGHMTSSVGRKGRLKMMRVEQRTEKRRTIYSPQLSRGHSWWEPLPRGERHWEDGWWGAEQRSLKKSLKIPPHPHPVSHVESYYTGKRPWCCVPLDRGGRRRAWGQAQLSAEQDMLGSSCVSHLLLVYGVGTRGGEGEQCLILVCLLLETQQFFIFILFGAKRTNLMIFSLFSPTWFKRPPFFFSFFRYM